MSIKKEGIMNEVGAINTLEEYMKHFSNIRQSEDDLCDTFKKLNEKHTKDTKSDRECTVKFLNRCVEAFTRKLKKEGGYPDHLVLSDTKGACRINNTGFLEMTFVDSDLEFGGYTIISVIDLLKSDSW